MLNQRATAQRAQVRGVHVAAAAHGLVHPAGSEDLEASMGADGGLQRRICQLIDAERADALACRLGMQERWTDVRRLAELRDPTVSHDWLWRLNPAHGPVVPNDEMATCLRIRLGASFTEEPTLCERCGKSIVGQTAAHNLCCAALEGTHGHYMVRDALLPLVHLADPSACTEVPELSASAPALRPADTLRQPSWLSGGPGHWYLLARRFWCWHGLCGNDVETQARPLWRPPGRDGGCGAPLPPSGSSHDATDVSAAQVVRKNCKGPQ